MIPWLRVPDLELWMGSLSDIHWETIHSFTQHSGMPPLVSPGSGLRGYQTNQKSMFLSQGLPEAPACAGDSPAACHSSPPPHGLAQMRFPSGWGYSGISTPLAIAHGLK